MPSSPSECKESKIDPREQHYHDKTLEISLPVPQEDNAPEDKKNKHLIKQVKTNYSQVIFKRRAPDTNTIARRRLSDFSI